MVGENLVNHNLNPTGFIFFQKLHSNFWKRRSSFYRVLFIAKPKNFVGDTAVSGTGRLTYRLKIFNNQKCLGSPSHLLLPGGGDSAATLQHRLRLPVAPPGAPATPAAPQLPPQPHQIPAAPAGSAPAARAPAPPPRTAAPMDVDINKNTAKDGEPPALWWGVRVYAVTVQVTDQKHDGIRGSLCEQPTPVQRQRMEMGFMISRLMSPLAARPWWPG